MRSGALAGASPGSAISSLGGVCDERGVRSAGGGGDFGVSTGVAGVVGVAAAVCARVACAGDCSAVDGVGRSSGLMRSLTGPLGGSGCSAKAAETCSGVESKADFRAIVGFFFGLAGSVAFAAACSAARFAACASS